MTVESKGNPGDASATATVPEELRQAADRLKAEPWSNQALAKLLATFASTIDRTPEKGRDFPLALEIARRVNAWEVAA